MLLSVVQDHSLLPTEDMYCTVMESSNWEARRNITHTCTLYHTCKTQAYGCLHLYQIFSVSEIALQAFSQLHSIRPLIQVTVSLRNMFAGILRSSKRQNPLHQSLASSTERRHLLEVCGFRVPLAQTCLCILMTLVTTLELNSPWMNPSLTSA